MSGSSAEQGSFTGRFNDGLEDGFLDDREAIDLARVHADDALIDRLNGSSLATDVDLEFADDELNALLLSWREDVISEPIGDLVDTDYAMATVRAAKIRKKHRPRLLVPVAAAAAVLAIAFTGVGLAARDAVPGDTLWGLTRVLYADHARSVEAADSVRKDLNEAQSALQSGKMDEAKTKLADAQLSLPEISSEDGKDSLTQQHATLLAQVGEPTDIPPTGTDPTSSPAQSSSQQTSSPSSPVDTTSPSNPPSSSTPTETTTPPVSSSTSEVPPPEESTPGRSDTPGDTPGDTTGLTQEEGAAVPGA